MSICVNKRHCRNKLALNQMNVYRKGKSNFNAQGANKKQYLKVQQGSLKDLCTLYKDVTLAME